MAMSNTMRRNHRSRWLVVPLLLASALSIGAPGAPEAAQARAGEPVTPVESVNLARYVGLWYEIAKIPNSFQRQCARHTIAHYTLRGDGRLNVVNQCIKNNGTLDQATGIAKLVDTVTQARLKVSFVNVLGWRPFWGDYWILGLDRNYRWAIVGTPDRNYGWILARTPTLEATTMDTIFAILERNGYQRTAFVRDRQRL